MGDARQADRKVTPWTLGQLRRAIEGLPDATPLRVEAAMGDDTWDEQVVVGAGFGKVVWRGAEEVDSVFGIECEYPPGDWAFSGWRYGSYRRPSGGGDR